MNKMFDLCDELINNKVSKIEIKKRINQGIGCIDSVIDWLKSVDPEAFVDSFVDHFPKAVEKAYDDGKISKQTVEDSRKMTVIFPSEITDGLYDLNKAMLELGETIKAAKNKS